jgi:hypothetical protein
MWFCVTFKMKKLNTIPFGYWKQILIYVKKSLYNKMSQNYSVLNGSFNASFKPAEETELRWGMLSLLLLIFCTTLGNLLVCLAVIWDRRLQNMTNYFLMSLAIADFLVSILVMPFGMIVEIYGRYTKLYVYINLLHIQ